MPVCSLGKRHRWDVPGFLWRLLQLLRRQRPDILHGYLAVPNLLTVLLKPLFPRTRMVWGERASNVDLSRYDRLSRLSWRVESRLAHFADLIVVNSRAGLRYAAANGFPEEKMVVIPNGIDVERFRPDPEAERRVRTEWGVSDDETLVGLVARMDPMKDHPTFLKAAAMLVSKQGGLRFVCVGDGSAAYLSELQALGRELGLEGRLIWAGARGDMSAVYNALDVAVSSSAYGEGFPNVIGEAMACGVPCVVTDVGDSAWIVGETGFVVEPGAPEALAHAIGRAVALIEAGGLDPKRVRQGVIERFSLNTMIEKSAEVLEEG